jgi:hypothetical protein
VYTVLPAIPDAAADVVAAVVVDGAEPEADGGTPREEPESVTIHAHAR